MRNIYYGVQIYIWLRASLSTKYNKRWENKLKDTAEKYNYLQPKNRILKQKIHCNGYQLKSTGSVNQQSEDLYISRYLSRVLIMDKTLQKRDQYICATIAQILESQDITNIGDITQDRANLYIILYPIKDLKRLLR